MRLYRGPHMRKCVGIFFVCDAVGQVLRFVFCVLRLRGAGVGGGLLVVVLASAICLRASCVRRAVCSF
ncbi:hypothetical protein BCAR13_1050001 [Paraburkholderia caribensis]|nr:hypothetical protein BCAR13_1050001 [Paraburkholderia caribensis]